MDLIEKCNRSRGARVWLWFFVAAACTLFLLLLPFIVRGNHLIWAVLEKDGAVQGVTFLQHVRNEGWLGAIGDYDYFMGLGSDYLAAMSFYSLFDPFLALLWIIPVDVVWVYDIIMVLKFVAAGAACLAYLRYRGVAGGYAVCLSLLYMLCGYVIFTFVRHLNLTSGVIWLPLMTMGMEKLYKKQNPFVLIASSFLCLVNSFYMFFFNSVFLVIYAFAYHGEQCRISGEGYFRTLWRPFIRVACAYLLAVSLAAFMLFPNAYAYLHAARSASKGLVATTFKFLTLSSLSLFFPTVAPQYSAISGNFFIFALAVFAFIAARKNGRAFRVCTAVFGIGFFVFAFGYAMNIFNYANNRWSYILSFSALALIGVVTTEKDASAEYAKPQLRVFAKTFSVAAGAAIVFSLCFAVRTLVFSDMTASAKIPLSILASLVAAAVVAFVVFLFSKRSPLADRPSSDGVSRSPVLDAALTRKIMRPKVLWHGALVCAAVFSVAYYGAYSAQHGGGPLYNSLSTPEGQYVSELNREEFFRTDRSAADNWWDCFRNYGGNDRYLSTNLYNSMNAGAVYDFVTENALYDPPQNLGISGLDNRPALQSLLSVKYYYGDSGSYGFTKVTGAEGVEKLYENENYLPFGFMYTQTLSRSAYDALDPVLRQYAMLGAMTVEGEGTLSAAQTAPLEKLNTDLPHSSRQRHVLRKNEPLNFTVNGCLDKETYLRLFDASEVEERTEFAITANGKTRTYMYAPKGDLMYSGERSPNICFGVSETDGVQVRIELLSGREISFSEISAFGYDISAYESAVGALKNSPHLQNVNYGGKEITGTISSQTEGYVFYSLPYDKGWSAEVDGEPVPVERANSAFMAVRVSAGSHEIRLTYKTPYLFEGCILSGIGLLAFGAVAAVYAVVYVRRRRSAGDGLPPVEAHLPSADLRGSASEERIDAPQNSVSDNEENGTDEEK